MFSRRHYPAKEEKYSHGAMDPESRYFPFLSMWESSLPANAAWAGWKALNCIIGRVNRFTNRCSSEVMAPFRYSEAIIL